MASVDAHLQELADIADAELDDSSARLPDDDAYREALMEMRALGGESAVDRLGEELKRSVRKSETFPQEQSVRSLGRDVLDDAGRDIPQDSWFAR